MSALPKPLKIVVLTSIGLLLLLFKETSEIKPAL